MTLPFLENMKEIEAILYLGVFVGVLLVFAGIQELLGTRTEEHDVRNRRMRMIEKGIDEEKILATLVGDRVETGRTSRGLVAGVRRRLRRAGLPIGVLGFLAVCVAVSALAYVGLSLRLPASASGAISIGLGSLLPFAIIDKLAKDRAVKLTRQLPDSLDMMARGLRVGHPLNVTLKRVAKEMPDPIGTEFGIIEDRTRHGADVGRAFAEFAARVDTEDAHYLAACVAIQHGTGGNLGHILSVLSRVIRDRMNMRMKIRAVSGEGRLSAIILSLMPFMIVGTVHASTPSYYLDVLDHPLFMPLAAAAAAMIVLQAFILRRLTNFEF